MPELDDGESGSDREDELPQVVVLKSGDLTEEEAKKVKADHTGDCAEKVKENKCVVHSGLFMQLWAKCHCYRFACLFYR